MKKQPAKSDKDDIKPKYRLDYAKSKPNRFASDLPDNSLAVVLDPDVASVFTSSESVNELLRSVISAFPEKRQSKTSKAS
jgi:hypothetical protein